MSKDVYKDLFSKFESLESYSHIDNSLYYGNMGICIAYFLSYKLSGEKEMLDKAKSKLKIVNNNLSDFEDYTFGSGLTGIGWAIEWLVQNNFINENTDEILASLDDELYKSLVYLKIPELTLENGIIGKGLYFYKRMLSENPEKKQIKRIYLVQCINIITDQILSIMAKTFSNKSHDLFEFSNLELIEIAQSVLFLTLLVSFGIGEIIKKTITQIISFIQDVLKTVSWVLTDKVNECMYLLYAYRITGYRLQSYNWKGKADLIYNTYLQSMPNRLLEEKSTDTSNNRILIKQLLPMFGGKKGEGNEIKSLLVTINELSRDSLNSWHPAWIL